MRTVKAVVQYDGSHFAGWQVQPNKRTVQSSVEDAVSKVVGSKVSLVAASRTDSGVHAEGQVVHFKVRSRLSDQKLREAINFYLNADVAVTSIRTVSDKFNARFHAKQKVYRYTIYNGPARPVFNKPFCLWFKKRLDINAVKRASKNFIGTHDFTSFASHDEMRRSKRRTIHKIGITKKRDIIEIEISGDGFLRNMVRIIVGTLIDIGSGKRDVHDIPMIFKSKNRNMASATASARGLKLVKVMY